MKILRLTIVTALSCLLVLGYIGLGLSKMPNSGMPAERDGFTFSSITAVLESLARIYSEENPTASLSLKATSHKDSFEISRRAAQDDDPVRFTLSLQQSQLHGGYSIAAGFPVKAISFVPIVNFPDGLFIALDQEALNGILSGRIQKWSDPYLVSINVATPLPDKAITFFHAPVTIRDAVDYALQEYGVSESFNYSSTFAPFDDSLKLLEVVSRTPFSLAFVENHLVLEKHWRKVAQVLPSTESYKGTETSDSLLPLHTQLLVSVDSTSSGSCESVFEFVEFMKWIISKDGNRSDVIDYEKELSWALIDHLTCKSDEAEGLTNNISKNFSPEYLMKHEISAQKSGSCDDGYAGHNCVDCSDDYAQVSFMCVECGGSSSVAAGIVVFLFSCLFCYLCCRWSVCTLEAFLNFTQFGSLTYIIQVDWDESLMLSLTKCLPANWIVSLMGVKCNDDLDYFFGFSARALLPVLGPVIILFLLLVYMPLRKLFTAVLGDRNRIRIFLENHSLKDLCRPSFHLLSTSLTIMTFYANESTLEYFKCTNTEKGKDMLVADQSIVCNEGKWNEFLPLAAIFVTLYMAIIPMFVIYVSFKSASSKAEDQDYLEFYGAITSRFKKSHVWWEGFISIRRVVICALLVHLSDDPHKCISVVSTLILLSLGFQLHQKPFLSPTVAFLENFLLFCNYCLVQVALIMNHHDESSKESTASAGLAIYYVAIGVAVLIISCDILSNFIPSKAAFLKDPLAHLFPACVSGPDDSVVVVNIQSAHEVNNQMDKFRKSAN